MKRNKILQRPRVYIKLPLRYSRKFRNALKEFYYGCINKVYGIYRRVKKIIEYIPLLWKDEDWDYCYLIDMLDYKLKRMAKCIDDNDIIADKEIVIGDINIVRKHIEEFNNPKEHECRIRGDLIKTGDVVDDIIFAVNKCRSCIRRGKCSEEYIELDALEHKSWENIWDTLKDKGRSFWD